MVWLSYFNAHLNIFAFSLIQFEFALDDSKVTGSMRFEVQYVFVVQLLKIPVIPSPVVAIEDVFEQN